MESIATLADAQLYFKEKGFSTIFQLTPQGLWDANQLCFHTYDKVQIVESIDVPALDDKYPKLRIFGLLISNHIKGLFIEIIIIIN